MIVKNDSAAARSFAGEGEMADAMRAMDWSRSPLGPVHAWPASIRTAVGICLTSHFQLIVLSGPELIYLYNDASIPIFGNKHPWALGQRVADVWPEAWPTLGPMLVEVFQTGRANRYDDLLLVLERHGFPEECYFTLSYSPISTDGASPDGVFIATMESTARVLSERRQRTLGALASKLAMHRGDADTYEGVRQALADNPYDVPLAALYLAAGDGRRGELAFCSGLRDGAAMADSVLFSTDDVGPGAHPASRAAACMAPQLVDAACLLAPGQRCGGWPEPVRQMLALPFTLPGQSELCGVLLLGANPRCPLDPGYRAFLDAVLAHVVTAATSVDAVAAERRRAAAAVELERARSAAIEQENQLLREISEVRHDLARVLHKISEAFASLDPQLRITALNNAGAAMLKAPIRRLTGRGVLAVLPGIEGSALHAALRAAVEQGQASTVEHFCANPDRWFTVRCYPAPQGLIVFADEITERKRSEQALALAHAELKHRVALRTEELREADQLLSAMFDLAPGSISLTDQALRFVRANPACQALLGYTEAELLGLPLSAVMDPADFAAALEHARLLRAGQVNSFEVENRCRRADGKLIWVNNFVSLIHDKQGQPLYFVTISQDVTERKRVEAERGAAQQELRVLYERLQTVRETERLALAREVHDQLGQLLSAAKIDIKLLEDDLQAAGRTLAPAEIIAELRSAGGTLDRGLQLVRQIATEMRGPKLDDDGLYATIAWHARDFERRTRIKTTLEISVGLPQPAPGAATALLGIFLEALTNVLRHAQAGQVWISLDRRADRLLLRVRDNGAGTRRQRRATTRSLGLTGMFERAALAGGRVAVGPLKPRGSLVSALMPLPGAPGAVTDPPKQQENRQK